MAVGRHRSRRVRLSGHARIAVPAVAVALIVSGSTAAAQVGAEGSAPASFVAGPEVVENGTDAVVVSVLTATDRRPSRGLERQPVVQPVHSQSGTAEGEARPKPVGSRFLTTALNVWTGPGENTTLVTVLPEGSKVAISGKVRGPWAEIVRDRRSRWVRKAYLVKERPVPEEVAQRSSGSSSSDDTGSASDEAESGGSGESSSGSSGGSSMAPCPSGSAVESGLTANAVAVHRAVCARFPQVTSFGGLRSDGMHGQGRALDIMVSGSLGDEIAAWLQANHSALGVSELLWSQRIWTVQRSSEGWRTFSDRGSPTANHYDHVHVTVY